MNFTSVMSMLINLYQKNYDKIKFFGVIYLILPLALKFFTSLFNLGECLSGAICESDLISYALEIGFTRPILVTQQPIGVNNEELHQLLG